jgi:hypothetical protein
MSNVSQFPSLITRARMSLLSHLKTIKDETTLGALRLALLWVNTASDAERLNDHAGALECLGKAQQHLYVASAAHKMHLTSPLTEHIA